MKNLRLIPDTHRQQEIIKAAFAFERELIAPKRNATKKSSFQKRVSPSLLSHSFATHLLEKGTDLRYIQELLGHGNSKTTEIYTRVSQRSLTNIKSPLDPIIDQRSTDNKHITQK